MLPVTPRGIDCLAPRSRPEHFKSSRLRHSLQPLAALAPPHVSFPTRTPQPSIVPIRPRRPLAVAAAFALLAPAACRSAALDLGASPPAARANADDFISAIAGRFGPLHLDDLAMTLAAGFAVLACLELLKPFWRAQLKA